MSFRKLVRESAFRLARHDLALFLADHEEDLLVIFREEMRQLDDDVPEENLFIDIKMVPLGEMILKAALRAMRRFLTEDLSALPAVETEAAPDETSGAAALGTRRGIIIRDG
ncbi:MAG: hypothetical protein GX620_14230 [Chloroflexi bacterium]|nr:hypothetical protein [Chloroflexota bacterium]